MVYRRSFETNAIRSRVRPQMSKLVNPPQDGVDCQHKFLWICGRTLRPVELNSKANLKSGLRTIKRYHQFRFWFYFKRIEDVAGALAAHLPVVVVLIRHGIVHFQLMVDRSVQASVAVDEWLDVDHRLREWIFRRLPEHDSSAERIAEDGHGRQHLDTD